MTTRRHTTNSSKNSTRWSNHRASVRTIVTMAVLSYAATAPAIIFDTFYLDPALHRATNIVLATEGETIDGRFTVLESWKGELPKGAEIDLPDMAAFADDELRQVKWGLNGTEPPEPYVSSVTCAQVVLFLRQPEEADSDTVAWLPTSYDETNGMRTSAIWIENGETYAIQQTFSDTPGKVSHLNTFLELKARITAYTVIQSGLDEAIRTKNPTRASQALRAFDRIAFFEGGNDAGKALGTFGPPAAPVLRRLREDRSLIRWHDLLLYSLAEAIGQDAIPDIAAELEEGLIYWKEHAPTLEKGWWNNAPDDQRQELRRRYSSQLSAMRLAGRINARSCQETIREIRTLWISQETLASTGSNQVAEECDTVLRALDGGDRM